MIKMCIVFKFVYNHLEENQSLLLVSSNPLFEPYSVSIKQVIEIWKFSAYFSKELPEVQMDALQLSLSYRNLHTDIQRILDKIKSALNKKLVKRMVLVITRKIKIK